MTSGTDKLQIQPSAKRLAVTTVLLVAPQGFEP
jgi:hypothetical protein